MDGGTLPPGQLPVPDGSDRDNYQAAFELLKEERYEPAAMAFQQFLVAVPGQRAGRQRAVLAGGVVLRDASSSSGRWRPSKSSSASYSGSRKVPDALLKMGYCNYELKRWDAARASLTRVQADYPETTAARLAGQRLQRMQEEGV